MVTVKAIYNPKRMTEGAGVSIQRVLGFETRYECDPFLLLDYFGSSSESEYMAGFPEHPHRGFETITYMLEGQVKHTDSTGSSGIIGPGEVQWMTAGSGIIHSEMPLSDSGKMYGIQLWLNLPQEYKMVKPVYRELKREDIPVVETTSSQVKVISGKYRKRDGGMQGLYKPVDIFDVKLWPDSVFDEVITPEFWSYKYFLFIYEGKVTVANDPKPIKAPCGVALSQGSIIQIRAGESGANFLFFGAEPNNEPIAWHGPIVMNTDAEIRKALEELSNGNFLK
ncbi:MAG: pirin family protein [Tenuifilum sp.]|uniref:pirin family protein n=1 Tax=Tenuifilum sp. TaxID=2760880 RepID=UPI0030B4901A